MSLPGPCSQRPHGPNSARALQSAPSRAAPAELLALEYLRRSLEPLRPGRVPRRSQDVTSKSWLVRTYYANRLFMGYCCVSCEVLYLVVRWGRGARGC